MASESPMPDSQNFASSTSYSTFISALKVFGHRASPSPTTVSNSYVISNLLHILRSTMPPLRAGD